MPVEPALELFAREHEYRRVGLRPQARRPRHVPERGDLAEHAARAARWLERSEEALHWFRTAASRLPDRHDLALEVVRELMRLERFEEADAALGALKSPPVDADALAQLKRAVRARFDPQVARSLLAPPPAEPAIAEPSSPSAQLPIEASAARLTTEQSVLPPGSPPDAVLAAEDGRRTDAERFLEAQLARNSSFPAARWRARIAQAFGDFDAAISAIAPQVDDSAPVALADARLAIHARIDAERIGDAWSELQRHAPQFALRDLAEERADLLRADLRLDEELQHLRDRVDADPIDETFASRLADAHLNAGDADAARPIIEQWSKFRPAGRVWAHKRLQLGWSARREWPQLIADSHQILDAAPAHLQTHLRMDHIRVLRKSGDFDAADRLLDAFAARVPGLALSQRERLALEAEVAHELTWLGRHAEARPRFDRLLREPMSQRMRDELLRLAAANESYGGGDLERLVESRNAISNPRHHLDVTPFAGTSAAASTPAEISSPQRVLVLLHLFHSDLWPELRDRLAQLDHGAMQLAVGAGERVSEEVLADVRQFAPNARIVRVENRGFDVGGHWQVLDRVDLREFDVALVLQTKKSSHTRVGDTWRHQLVDALIGSRARWQENLRSLEAAPSLGLIGSAWHQSSFHPWSTPEMRDVLGALGMPLQFDALKAAHRFVTGTMFLIRASLLAEMHAKMRLPFERPEDLSLARLSDNSRAHAMERAFGMYVAWRGYEACWRP